MDAGFLWAALGLLAGFGWLVIGMLQERQEASQRMRLREMLHRERMKALEQGLELPDTDADDLLQESFGSVGGGDTGARDRAVRRSVLGVGLVLLLGGMGWYLGMSAVPATDQTLGMQELASLGAIPAMIGVGLLVFWFVLGRDAR